MPKYLISINGPLEVRTRAAIAKGIFRNLDHIVEVALENQLTAEEGGLSSWGKVPAAAPPASPSSITRERMPGTGPRRRIAASAVGGPPSPPAIVDPDLRMPEGDVPTVADPDPSAIAGPLLWGQHYKFLPAKAALRVLARIASNTPQLGAFSENASLAAVVLGEKLRSIDKAGGRKLGNQIATSFPEGSEKSTRRFRDQYLAYLRPSDRKIDGMLPRLRFVAVYSDEGSNRVGLTMAGREFAGIRNPVIDGGAVGPSLSDEEIWFLLHHIQVKLPAEARHMASLVRLASQGATSPEELNQRMEGFYKDFQDAGRPWTPAHLNTMRAGVTSRLFELGLIAKKKDGVSVSYYATDRGRRWLAQFDKES